MFKRRGSFKVAPGVRANWGRGGLTSVNVGGVRLGGVRRSTSRRSGPTKTELIAEQWRLRPGIHYVRIKTSDDDAINLVVDGRQLTYRRVIRIMDGLQDGNTDAVARAFTAFVKRWDIFEDDGSKPLPLSMRGVERLGVEMIFGLTVETANALNIPKKPLSHVLHDSASGKPVRVSVSTSPPPSADTPPRPPQTAIDAAADESVPTDHDAGGKSAAVAWLLWLLTGLIGGHRYYLGRYKTGILMTLTLGGLGMWWLVDAILLPGMPRSSGGRI